MINDNSVGLEVTIDKDTLVDAVADAMRHMMLLDSGELDNPKVNPAIMLEDDGGTYYGSSMCAAYGDVVLIKLDGNMPLGRYIPEHEDEVHEIATAYVNENYQDLQDYVDYYLK